MVKDVRQGFPERCVQVSKVMFCRNGTTGSIGNSRQNMDVVNELQVTKAIHGKVWLWGKVCTTVHVGKVMHASQGTVLWQGDVE